MSRDVRIHNVEKVGDNRFSVEATVSGHHLNRTYPRNGKWLAEDEDGVPKYVHDMIKDVEKKERRSEMDTDKRSKTSFQV